MLPHLESATDEIDESQLVRNRPRTSIILRAAAKLKPALRVAESLPQRAPDNLMVQSTLIRPSFSCGLQG